jgi:hypothetical protein
MLLEYQNLQKKFEKTPFMICDTFIKEFPIPNKYIENRKKEYYNIFNIELIDKSEQEEMCQIDIEYFPQFVFQLLIFDINGEKSYKDILKMFLE